MSIRFRISAAVAFGMALFALGCGESVDQGSTELGVASTRCAFSQGYWKSQTRWPVSSLHLGTVSYTEAQLRAILSNSTRGNGLVDLAHQLIAAKLNAAIGANSTALFTAIANADTLIGSRVVPPVGNGFLSPTATTALTNQLEAFNNGQTSVQCILADLAVTKTVSNPTPTVGDTITYTVTVTDIGPSTATNVTITDLLPAGLSFVSATPSQGSYNNVSGVWSIGTVTASTPQTLLMQATVASPSAQTNTASISHSDEFDPTTANNSASATVSPLQADLAIAKAVSNGTPAVGDTISYTVTVSDLGPGDATNVSVLDLLPAGLTFISATPSQGSYDNITGIWNIGTVANSTSATCVFSVTVVSLSQMTNTASINHSDQFDPNTSNNSASATITPH